jgi:hypothetical protein
MLPQPSRRVLDLQEHDQISVGAFSEELNSAETFPRQGHARSEGQLLSSFNLTTPFSAATLFLPGGIVLITTKYNASGPEWYSDLGCCFCQLSSQEQLCARQGTPSSPEITCTSGKSQNGLLFFLPRGQASFSLGSGLDQDISSFPSFHLVVAVEHLLPSFVVRHSFLVTHYFVSLGIRPVFHVRIASHQQKPYHHNHHPCKLRISGLECGLI